MFQGASQSLENETRFLVDDPWTGEIAAEVPLLDRREAFGLVERVARSQRDWGRSPLSERLALCRAFAHALEDRLEEAALEITRQMGKPLTQARSEVRTCIDRARTLIDLAPDALAPEDLAPLSWAGGAIFRRISREPVGVVLDIAAWNYPLLTAVNVVVAAVLAGNGVLIKHAPRTPLCADRFVSAFRAAGAPPDLVASLPVTHDVAAAVMGRREIGHVAFTGSPRGGREVARTLSPRFVDLGLELGGKDAAWVAEDADLDFAVANLVEGAFYNAGQSCCAVERIYVHASLYDDFVERAVAAASAWIPGDPMDEGTTLGPMAQPASLQRLEAQVREAAEKGARVLCGGGSLQVHGKGRFFAPTVVANADHDMALMVEESFGPVVGVAPASSDEEAILLMNDSPYGLTASIWTGDLERAGRIGAELEVGTVFANRCDYVDPSLPWSGKRESGQGLSLSRHGITALTRPKSWHFRQRLP